MNHLRRRTPRMTQWTVITLILMIALYFTAPQQLHVVLYKTGMVTLAAVLAYWIDRALFPDHRPHECGHSTVLAAAWIRRGLIVLACVLGLTLGL